MFKRFAPGIASKEFSFKDPDTKKAFQGTSISDLASKVRFYRAQNELPDLPYLETVIETYLCKLPANLGGCEPLPKLKRGLIATIRGGIAIIQTLAFQKFAPQEEADKRSEICKDCPLNTFPDKGPFVAYCDDIAEQVVGSRRSKHHNDLGVCSGCSCGLRFKVFYAEPIKLNKKQRAKMEEANPRCWQL
jgi:hypothetical protein